MSQFKLCIASILLCALLAACSRAETYKQKLRTFHTPQEFEKLTAGKVQMHRQLDPQQQVALRLAVMQWPSPQFTVIAVESPAVTWVGTKQGAIRLSEETKRLEYFGAQRWLRDDHVTGIGFDDNATWLETPKGFSRIEYKSMTLAEKSKIFVERIQKRHN